MVANAQLHHHQTNAAATRLGGGQWQLGIEPGWKAWAIIGHKKGVASVVPLQAQA